MSFWDGLKKFGVELGHEYVKEFQKLSGQMSNVGILMEEYESLSDYELKRVFENAREGSEEYIAAGKLIKRRMGR